MEINKDTLGDIAKDHPQSVHQPQQQIRREVDSLDDFEHLGHDISPLKEAKKDSTADLLGSLHEGTLARDVVGEINKGVETAASTVDKFTDEVPFRTSPKLDKPIMDSNLLEMGDAFPDRKEADEKLDKFLNELASFAPPVPKHQIEEIAKEKDEVKNETKNFVNTEKGGDYFDNILQPTKVQTPNNDLLERYSDSEPELEDFKPSSDFHKKEDHFKTDTFKDVDEMEPELPKRDFPQAPPSPLPDLPKPSAPAPELVGLPPVSEPAKKPEPKSDFIISPEPEEPPKRPEPAKVLERPKEEPPKKPEPAREAPPKKPDAPKETKIEKIETKLKETVIEAEAMFCKMGLDAWFNPERLNPKVESLIYWRDPKKSGPVFGGVLVVLLALTYFSLISVVAYLSLLALTGTISFRIYKNIVQAVQKTGDGHPFKEFLEFDVALSQEKVTQISGVAVAHFNAAINELRRLFLVEDLVDSIKFAVSLWCLTYLGAWFNGMTLIIIKWVALFTLPKVYETNKTQIDANLEIVRSKLADITSKVKAAIPIGKKAEEKKEQ